MQDSDDGLLAFFDRRDAVLEFQDVPTETVGFAGSVAGGGGELSFRCGLGVGLGGLILWGSFGVGGGRSGEWFDGSNGELTWTSRPAVKARSPAPVRITARTEGSCESFLKMAERLSHMLMDVSHFRILCFSSWWTIFG